MCTYLLGYLQKIILTHLLQISVQDIFDRQQTNQQTNPYVFFRRWLKSILKFLMTAKNIDASYYAMLTIGLFVENRTPWYFRYFFTSLRYSVWFVTVTLSNYVSYRLPRYFCASRYAAPHCKVLRRRSCYWYGARQLPTTSRPIELARKRRGR